MAVDREHRSGSVVEIDLTAALNALAGPGAADAPARTRGSSASCRTGEERSRSASSVGAPEEEQVPEGPQVAEPVSTTARLEISSGPELAVASPAPAAPLPAPVSPNGEDDDLEDVFRRMRERALTRRTPAAASQAFVKAVTCERAGLIAEAIDAYHIAAGEAAHAYEAALALGRLYRSSKDLSLAVDWLEHAAGFEDAAPAARALAMYELAETLELAGDKRRAIAVWRRLSAFDAEYRDVRVRLARALAGD